MWKKAFDNNNNNNKKIEKKENYTPHTSEMQSSWNNRNLFIKKIKIFTTYITPVCLWKSTALDFFLWCCWFCLYRAHWTDMLILGGIFDFDRKCSGFFFVLFIYYGIHLWIQNMRLIKWEIKKNESVLSTLRAIFNLIISGKSFNSSGYNIYGGYNVAML